MIKEELPVGTKYMISTDLDISKKGFKDKIVTSKLLEDKQVEGILVNYKGYLLGN